MPIRPLIHVFSEAFPPGEIRIMNSPESVPTWSDLFGSPDTKEADAGRSVTAPAAYLADLLQLLEDRFDPSDFRSRRPDITSQILLNGEQSFSLARQLDIANRVLGGRIASLSKKPAEAVDEVLAGAQHPFSLPFEYQHERIRQLLLLLRTPYRDLYTSFAQHVDVDVLARERLGLSPARADTVAKDLSGDAAGLRAAFGLAPDETLSSLAGLERFRRATQLDGTSLRELLFSQLSQSDGGGVSERRGSSSSTMVSAVTSSWTQASSG
jgi:Salmonella virulence plasmid 28.1kDa A protein